MNDVISQWSELDLFLKSPQRHVNCLKSEHLAGFMLGVSAAPQYVDMQEWLHFVLGDDEASYQALMSNEAASQALFSLSNDVDELVFNGTCDLPNNCAAVADLSVVSPLSQFCDGLLKAHFFLLPLWDNRLQEAANKGVDTSSIQQNLDQMLSVVSTLADPVAAINNHPEPEKLKQNMHALKFELGRMINSYGRLATLLNALIEGVDLVQEPVKPKAAVQVAKPAPATKPRGTIREIKGAMQLAQAKATIGRNDPCYCGSGKKYKKCCMNRAG